MSPTKKKLIWVSKIGDCSSLSRVSEAILPHLLEKFDITTLMTKQSIDEMRKSNIKLLSKITPVHLGADTSVMSWEEFLHGWKINRKMMKMADNKLECCMKYALVQIADIIYKNHADYVMITISPYECNWFMELIQNSRHLFSYIDENNKTILSKIIVWSPIDYIPTLPVVRWLLEADYILTMTPTMADELKKLDNILMSSNSAQTKNKVIAWAEHGIDLNEFLTIANRDNLVDRLNTMKGTVWNGADKISVDDIIILNANAYNSRKRLDLTLESFGLLLNKYEDMKENGNSEGIEGLKHVKLWMHTNIDKCKEYFSFFFTKYPKMRDRIFYSNNDISGAKLNMIYNVCQIGVQTSWGEGWSLTNCEHSLVGGLQVVPNWLATGFHFSESRGILVPVKEETFLNEANYKTTIGVVNAQDVMIGLQRAVTMIKENTYDKEPTINYLHTYSWKGAADKIIDAIDC